MILLDKFIGREDEINSLGEMTATPGAKIVVIYGRRRVGKTSLIEHVFADRKIMKFEGTEGKGQPIQRQKFLEQLSVHCSDPVISKLRLKSWHEILIEVAKRTATGPHTIYFEEIQWMASYKEDLIVDLKYVWDNYFQKNPELILILCGSSPSFLIDKVMMSKALYNRSQYEFPISQLSLTEAQQLLGADRSREEVLDAYLTVGGIPEYLKRLKQRSSIYLSLCDASFKKGGFFVNEADRVFVSSLAKNNNYRRIIEYIAKHGATSKNTINKILRLKSGGTTSALFKDLDQCGFIGSYGPLAVGSQKRDAKWHIADPYLRFYYRFIKPVADEIKTNSFKNNLTTPLDYRQYRQWLGYSFERFCVQHARQFASILGFDAIRFSYGPFYLKGDVSNTQIDLLYERADKVYTLAEIKFTSTPPGKEVIEECEKKINLLLPKATVQRVLISPNGAEESVIRSRYFDRIVTLDKIFQVVG